MTVRPISAGCRGGGLDEAAIRLLGEGPDRALNGAGALRYIDRAQLDPRDRCRGLQGPELPAAGGSAGTPDHRHAGRARRDLLEQTEPLRGNAKLKEREAGGVAAWPR
jgi:hypothetical protein